VRHTLTSYTNILAFRGSSKNQKSKPKKSKRDQDREDFDGEIDLDEGDSADGEEEDEDDLGEDAIDLATALDQYEEDEAEERREAKKQKNKQASAFDDTDSEGEDVPVDGASDLSSDDDMDDEEDRQAQLQDLISSLATKEDDKAKGRRVEVHESAAPDEFGVARKVDLLSFKPKVGDEEKKRALKLLRDDKSSTRNDIARKLEAPLPKRAQDKLDRAAANAKANETLERWTDTIKNNRRAEHLMFPLQNPNGGDAGERTLLPTTTSAPANDLEATIQSILQQSGLSNGKEDEEKLQKWEVLQTNKLPVEEVLRRRQQLRMERELLFREEVRSKRIKKIKSKAYRRVHRKERERLLEKEREQLKADGVDLSEEEREYNDRRRAEERMGAKHRDSKWAKVRISSTSCI
jgi:U3 small nucleolar RNA-associated protein 14